MKLLATLARAFPALVLGSGAIPACTCSQTPALPAEAAADFGNLAVPAPGAGEMVPYLAAARAVIEKKAPASLPALPGRRVFVAFWPGQGGGTRGEALALVASANGSTLGDAVLGAAGRVAAELAPLAPGHDPTTGRIEIDVATSLA